VAFAASRDNFHFQMLRLLKAHRKNTIASGKPAAETREYRLRFWDKGEVSGDWSAVQKVTVGV